MSVTKTWSQLIQFNKTAQGHSWHVQVVVTFDAQNVPAAMAEFTVHRTEAVGPSKGHAAAIVVILVLSMCVVTVVLGIFYWKTKANKRYTYMELANEAKVKTISLVEELTMAEYVYKVDVPDRKRNKSTPYREAALNVTKLITALANTCGGVIFCDKLNDAKKMTDWKKDCRSCFEKYTTLAFDTIATFCECDEQERVAVFVGKSQRFVYLYPGLDRRRFTNIDDSTELDRYEHIRCPHRNPIRNKIMSFLSHLRQTTLHERHEYCRITEPGNLDEYIENHASKKEELIEQVSDIKKSEKGGIIIFVSAPDTGRDYQGLTGDVIPETKQLEKLFEELYQEAKKSSHSDETDKTYRPWTHRRVPITDDTYSILWYIRGTPIVYGIADSGSVNLISLEELDRRSKLLTKSKPNPKSEELDGRSQILKKSKPNPISGDLEMGNTRTQLGDIDDTRTALLDTTQDVECEDMGTGDVETSFSTDTRPINNRERNRWYLEPHMKEATTNAIQHQVLSWGANSFVWETDPSAKQTRVSFALTSPVNLVPSKHTIASFAPLNKHAAVLRELKEVKRKFVKRKGCVVFLQNTADFIELMLLHEDGNPEISYISICDDVDGKTLLECESGRYWKKEVCKKLENCEYFLSEHATETLSFIIKTSSEKNSTSSIDVKRMKLASYLSSGTCDSLNESLYKLLAANYVEVTHRLGDNKLYELGEKNAAPVIASGKSFHYVQGPPGSGKSLIAHIIYHELSEDKRVLYCCPTECFKAKLKSINVKNAMVVYNEKALRNLYIHLKDYDVIIFDDTQRIEWKDITIWKQIFENMLANKQVLYMFVDSDYQNYSFSDGIHDIKRTLGAICQEDFYEDKLTEVYRNCKKVFSFMKENLNQKLSEDITCHHEVHGDDVLLCHLKDSEADDESNGLLRLVKSLLGETVEGRVYKHHVRYSPAELALIIGGDDADSCRDFLRRLFDDHYPEANAQDARTQPVKGTVIETADNFCGLDSLVCIFYPGKITTKTTTIKDERYKTYIASRGINLVIFVNTSETISMEEVEDLHMGQLENIMIDTYSHWHKSDIAVTLECLLHAEDNDDVLNCLSAITATYGDEDAAKSFVEHNGIDHALRRINKHEAENDIDDKNKAIRERALMTFTAVALHHNTLPELMRSDVIQAACESMKSDWDPEWWEAAYLLGHMLHKGGKSWKGKHPRNNEVEKELVDCLDSHDEMWVQQRESAVAHGKVDYTTYNEWIKQDKIAVLRLFAMLSLWNLILTEGGNECPNLQKHIGIDKIVAISEDGRYDKKIQTLASNIIEKFDENKIVPGAFKRYYNATL